MTNKYQEALDELIKYTSPINPEDVDTLQELIDLYAKKNKMWICDLHKKCGGCIYLNYNDSNCCGYRCDNTEKIWKRDTSSYRYKTVRCCKKYVERNDIELVYEYKRGRKQR